MRGEGWLGWGRAYAGDGEVFDEDGGEVHAEVDQDGDFGGHAVEDGDEEWSGELADEVNPAHLCVQDWH